MHQTKSHRTSVFTFSSFLLQVDPSSTDRVTHEIQKKLGDFSHVKPYLEDPKRLIGIDGVPASPSPGLNPAALSRLQPQSEFKKPHQANGRPTHHPHPRGGFVKPADGKPPYEGRGGYPGQPVKHGSGTNNHRSSGIVPAKGPPPPSSSSQSSSISSSSRIHNSARNLPRIHLDQVSHFCLLFVLVCCFWLACHQIGYVARRNRYKAQLI